ncbi:MAG TPA: hypothetical protein VFK34_00140 [Marmoricola sp.]|jgi:hypothetical protein|nr:hypothetical protein [Marmoricola sp.]
MKKALATLAAALLLATAACGSDGGQELTHQEQKVADNIAKELSASSGARLPEKDATCFAEKFVADAGVKALKDSKLIDADGSVQQSGAKFDKPLAEKYADAYLSCVDFSAQVAKTFAESDEGIDEEKLAQCLDEELPDSLVKKVIIDTRSPDTANSKDVTEANQKVAECQKQSQKDVPKDKQKKDSKKQ